jgi:hypothetical protein
MEILFVNGTLMPGLAVRENPVGAAFLEGDVDSAQRGLAS